MERATRIARTLRAASRGNLCSMDCELATFSLGSRKEMNRAKEQEIFNEIHDYSCCAAIEPFYVWWLFDYSPVRARIWPGSFYFWGDNLLSNSYQRSNLGNEPQRVKITLPSRKASFLRQRYHLSARLAEVIISALPQCARNWSIGSPPAITV
jgi:hypothetical protein